MFTDGAAVNHMTDIADADNVLEHLFNNCFLTVNVSNILSK